MSTHFFFKPEPHASKSVTKVEARADGHIFIAGRSAGGTDYIQEWDLRNISEGREYTDYGDNAFDGEPVIEAERTPAGNYRVFMNVYYNISAGLPTTVTGYEFSWSDMSDADIRGSGRWRGEVADQTARDALTGNQNGDVTFQLDNGSPYEWSEFSDRWVDIASKPGYLLIDHILPDSGDTVILLNEGYTDAELITYFETNTLSTTESTYVYRTGTINQLQRLEAIVEVRSPFINAVAVDTFPDYPLWLSTDTQESLGTATATKSVTATYADKQGVAVDAIENVWRPQKQAWLQELILYADINPDLIKHAGYYLNAAEQAIQSLFQDSARDPLVVAAVAKAAALGAADIDTVEKFAEELNGIIAANPNGPANKSIWVQINADDTVTRTNLLNAVNYGTFESNFNSITHDWIVDNQPGKLDTDATSYAVGDTLTADLTDYDGIITGTTTWAIKKETATPGTFEDFATPTGTDTGLTYQIPNTLATNDKIQVIAEYQDNFGQGQGTSSSTSTITYVELPLGTPTLQDRDGNDYTHAFNYRGVVASTTERDALSNPQNSDYVYVVATESLDQYQSGTWHVNSHIYDMLPDYIQGTPDAPTDSQFAFWIGSLTDAEIETYFDTNTLSTAGSTYVYRKDQSKIDRITAVDTSTSTTDAEKQTAQSEVVTIT